VGSSSHVVDERRLRPIYDALDNLNNKQAIKLADALLKKQKECACAKALKALALLRSHKKVESNNLLENIKETTTKFDDPTLQAMTMCYKESSNIEGIITIYELAVKQCKENGKENEEFLSHLFMAYVRVGNFSKQQQVAMNLYKAHPKNPYYFWAVMSNVMQAITTEEGKKRTMFLSLAERMVKKFIGEGKMESQEEKDLYMMILELMGKHEEILKFLKEESALKRRDLEIECLAKLGRNVELNVLYKDMLTDYPDEWSHITGLINTCLELKDYKPDAPIDTENKQPIHTIENLTEFISNLGNNNSFMRGPPLGGLEICKLTKDVEGARVQLIEYFKRFGGKPCCYNDMRPYLHLIDDELTNKKFIDDLKSTHTPTQDGSSHSEKINKLNREICIECIAMQLNYHSELSKDEKFAKAKQYVLKYNESLSLGKDLKPTEPQYGDTLIQLSFHILVELNNEIGDDSKLWHIILMLEEAAEKSKTFPAFKLFLIFLYAQLGASSACEKLLEDLEVKYIVYDSLGYLFSNATYNTGQFQLTQRIYDHAFSFYKASERDIPEQLASGYKYGSFRQVEEMTELKDRLKRSAHRYHIVMEQMFINIAKECNNMLDTRKKFNTVFAEELQQHEVTEGSVKTLWNNRDMDFVNRFDPMRDYSSEHQESFDQQLVLIRYRYLTLQLLRVCLNQRKDEQEETLAAINTQLKEYGDFIETLNDKSFPTKWECIHRPKSTDLHHIIRQQKHPVIVQNLVQLVVRAASLKTGSDESESDFFSKTFESVSSQIKEIHENLSKELVIENENVFNGKSLPQIVFFMEICSVVAVLTGSIKESLQQHESGVKTRKRNKANQNKKEDKIGDAVITFAKEMSTLLKQFGERLLDIKKNNIDKTLNDKAMVDLFEKTSSTVVTKIWDKVQSSYEQSILELNQIIEFKTKFFQSLA